MFHMNTTFEIFDQQTKLISAGNQYGLFLSALSHTTLSKPAMEIMSSNLGLQHQCGYIALAFDILHYSKINETDFDNSYFLAFNMLAGELSKLSLKAVAGIWNTYVSAIIWLDTKDDVLYRTLYNHCQRLGGQMGKLFGHPVQCAISKRFSDYNLASNAADEVHEAMLFARFINNPPAIILQQEDYHIYGKEHPSSAFTQNEYFVDVCVKIANAIDGGELVFLLSLGDECSKYIVGDFPRVSAIHFNAITFFHMLEFQLVGDNIVDRRYFSDNPVIPLILDAKNENDFNQVFQNVMQEVFAYAHLRKESKYADTMISIMEYIEGNLHDPSLSIGSAAECFDISPITLSNQFKIFFGNSVPETIHQKRIQKIKEGLSTTNKSIKQLAAESGYISVATLNRAFVKYEGVYPSTLKNKRG